jgi:endonuclease/exonuclease/phosphatase (EEP) superfamily protein YafD
VHFGLAFLACALLLAGLRHVGWAAAAAAAAVVALAPVLPWHFGRDATPIDPTRPYLKLIVANVYRGNHWIRPLENLIAAESPDVIGLIEVTPRWMRRLKSLHDRYPFRFELPHEDVIGLAIYSRFRLENARLLSLPGENWTPMVAATLKAPGGDVEILLVHPPSPVSAEHIAHRNRQILELARHVAAVRGPVILAGDFNLTMWNSGYRPLVDVAGLHNARKGYGVGPTWPSRWKLGVPIDHIVGTRDVRFRDFRVLGDIGSDHYPVYVEFRAP